MKDDWLYLYIIIIATVIMWSCAHAPQPSPALRACADLCARRYGAIMPNAHVVGDECRCVADTTKRVWLHANLRSKSLLHPPGEGGNPKEKEQTR